MSPSSDALLELGLWEAQHGAFLWPVVVALLLLPLYLLGFVNPPSNVLRRWLVCHAQAVGDVSFSDESLRLKVGVACKQFHTDTKNLSEKFIKEHETRYAATSAEAARTLVASMAPKLTPTARRAQAELRADTRFKEGLS